MFRGCLGNLTWYFRAQGRLYLCTGAFGTGTPLRSVARAGACAGPPGAVPGAWPPSEPSRSRRSSWSRPTRRSFTIGRGANHSIRGGFAPRLSTGASTMRSSPRRSWTSRSTAGSGRIARAAARTSRGTTRRCGAGSTRTASYALVPGTGRWARWSFTTRSSSRASGTRPASTLARTVAASSSLSSIHNHFNQERHLLQPGSLRRLGRTSNSIAPPPWPSGWS